MATPSSTIAGVAATPLPTPGSEPERACDLQGTVWSLLQLPGIGLAPDTTPTIEFMVGDAKQAIAFVGCGYVGLSGSFVDGRIEGLALGPLDPGCRATEMADAFVTALESATSWIVWVRAPDGADRLMLSGPGGALQFERLAPSRGASRMLLDTLRERRWRIASATGVRNVGTFQSVQFGDRHFVVQGPCGVTGSLTFRGPDGEITLEAYFDTTVCAADDERIELTRVLDAATEVWLDPSEAVHLAGAAGEVVLTREALSAARRPVPSLDTVEARSPWPGRLLGKRHARTDRTEQAHRPPSIWTEVARWR